jgi:hypothetical protein
MAKRKPEPSGPGIFMILALVFFVLATAVLGVTTYLGFKDADQWEKAADTAKKDKAAAEKNAAEQRNRVAINRVAMGTDSAEDREAISGAGKELADATADEIKLITDKLGAAGVFPTRNEFTWPVDADGKRAPAPNKNIPAIARQWAGLYKNMEQQFKAQEAARKKAEVAQQAAQDASAAEKATFEAAVKKLNDEMKTKIAAMDAAFKGLKDEADKAGINFKKQADEWAEVKAKLEETVNAKDLEIKAKNERIARLLSPDASDLESRLSRLDVSKTAERMGIVTDKSGTFVNIRFETRMNLVPGQTFVVIPSTGSLVEVLEREKALDKHHREHTSLGPRDPFADNEMVKGTVEITDVTSQYSARARITDHANPVRNPISKGDQLFNISLSTGEKEHVAFAGIIDLDGDGRPNNEEFVRILEKNNLVIDAYLDLKSGEIKGRGIDFKTKFLIVGSDAPVVGNVKTMVDQAKEKAVQLIDARMFLHLIGVKPPKNPAPPAYSSVTLGKEGALAPKDPDAPVPPPADPKKN